MNSVLALSLYIGSTLSNAATAQERSIFGTVPTTFTACETFDVGVDLDFVVSLKHMDRAPVEFNGIIHSAKVDLS